MAFPAFFDEVPVLRLHDGLCQLLGASDNGILEYHYSDAVRLAGHSCPTVAGAWLMAQAGLEALYPHALPERGELSVSLPGAEDHGVSGVIGQVLTLVTGAAAANGFHGFAGRHRRNGLLHYGADIGRASVRLQRNDTGAAVDVSYDPSSVPPSPVLPVVMEAVAQGFADAAQTQQFGELWQDRVRALLLEHAGDPAVISAQPVR
ncbi:MAG TPA: hypothetical protein VFQ88_05325 [Nevskiaceae bacterium]|nr:hypothetical protein [Nevskiaceae bacterium]